MNITKQEGKLAIVLGVGIMSGIISVWLNYLVFKTGTLFGLSLSYTFIGLLFIIVGSIIFKKGDIEVNIFNKKTNEEEK
jgi:hypothetical protein